MPEIPYGYCHCGCGQKTNVCRCSHKARGMVKGEPNKFIAGHQSRTDVKERFWVKVEKRSETECWLWLAAVRRIDEGYGAFWLDGRHQPSSRVAWLLTFGEIPQGLQVLHKCDNPRCCNPSHLFLGTNQDNNKDKVSKDRHIYGSRNMSTKLTEMQASEIKNMNHRYARKVGLIYGVTRHVVADIWRGRTWKHVN